MYENHLYLDKPQSLLASSIVYLARNEEFSLLQISPDAWSSELQEMIGYCELDLIELAESLKNKKTVLNESKTLAESKENRVVSKL